MESVAKYRGAYPVMGVKRDDTYTLDMSTIRTAGGTPYMWVRIKELPDYLMPYESMLALLGEWDFSVGEGKKDTPMLDHLDLIDHWLEVYMPDCDRLAEKSAEERGESA